MTVVCSKIPAHKHLSDLSVQKQAGLFSKQDMGIEFVLSFKMS